MEISRRCLACGASVRARALFCPYCGEKLEAASSQLPPTSPAESALQTTGLDASRTQANFSATVQIPVDDEGLQETADLSEQVPERIVPHTAQDESPVPPPPLPSSPLTPPVVAPSAGNENLSVTIAPTAPLPPVTPHESSTVDGSPLPHDANAPSHTIVSSSVPSGRKAGVRSAVAARAENFGEKARPRVEKLRDRSTAWVEEASDDPGLRFVLIAVLLFIVFIVFLVFSHIIG